MIFFKYALENAKLIMSIFQKGDVSDMRVNALQSMDGTVMQPTISEVGQKEDFSSYLQTTASLEQIFTEASQTYNVPKNLIKAIAKAESDFNPNATSGAGAQGIMQLMPGTARELGVTDSYDPYQNIMPHAAEV